MQNQEQTSNVCNTDDTYLDEYEYLRPLPENYQKINHPLEYCYNLKKKSAPKQARRKVYGNPDNFTEFEKKGIQELKDAYYKLADNKRFQLPKKWEDSDWLKMCYTDRFNYKECLKKMETHCQWKNALKNHTLNDNILKFLQEGYIYQCGRDRQQRPVLYISVKKILQNENILKKHIDDFLAAISFFLGMIKKYMFVPNHIENWVVIIDLDKQGVTDIPRKLLQQMIGTMSTNFCATLEKMFLLKPSGMVKFLWGGVAVFMDDETADKIQMLKSDADYQKIKELIDPKYIQKQYLGNLNDLQQFWPPPHLFDDYNQMVEARRMKQEQEKQEKIKLEKEQKLKQEQEEKQKELIKNQEQQEEVLEVAIQNQQPMMEQDEETVAVNGEPQPIEVKGGNDDVKNEQTFQRKQGKEDSQIIQPRSNKAPQIMLYQVEDELTEIYKNNGEDKKQQENKEEKNEEKIEVEKNEVEKNEVEKKESSPRPETIEENDEPKIDPEDQSKIDDVIDMDPSPGNTQCEICSKCTIF